MDYINYNSKSSNQIDYNINSNYKQKYYVNDSMNNQIDTYTGKYYKYSSINTRCSSETLDKSYKNSTSDIFYQKYCKYKKKYLSLKNQYGSSVSKQKNFGKRLDGQIETVEWSKEDHMTKDTPVGTLFTTGSVNGIVFRIIKIVDGPTETETETVNNKDGTIKQVLKAVKTVDRICTAAINLSNGNIDGLRCFFPQSLINSDYLNRYRKLGRFSFGINGGDLATKINNGQELNYDERAWQMIYNSKMVNPDNSISSIKNKEEFNNYINRLSVKETEKAKIESQKYSAMINATMGIREEDISDAVKEMEKLPPR